MSTPSWHSVKPRVLKAIDEAKDALTTCEADDVTGLQARVKALRDLIAMFEAPEDDARKISDPGGY